MIFTQGTKIGPYTVERLIGEGATATVYKATDPKLKRPVAIKVLRENLEESGNMARFEREVRLLVDVRHPGIVQVFSAGMVQYESAEADKRVVASPYYAMEMLQGKSVREVIDQRLEARTPTARQLFKHDELLSVWRQLAEAIHALHRNNPMIIHRDLKPSNIMIVPPLRVVLIDFGLAQLGDQMGMTAKSRGLGTQAYMSPEQLDGSKLDERSDVFALGLIMHEMVSGQVLGGRAGVPPWFRDKKREWDTPLPTSYDRTLPATMEQIILDCLKTDQLNRVRDMHQLLERLNAKEMERILPAGQIPARRIGDAGTAVPGAPKNAPPQVLAGAKPPLEVLKSLSNYEIEGLLGAGAMGEVYRARQKDLDRPVAIKVMKAAFATDPSLKERFARELDALAKLQHPRIVSVFDYDFEGEVPYCVMELVNSQSLSRIVEQRGILPVDEALLIFADLIEALDACHQRGLLHRDIKPENVLVEADGHSKLTDFGLVKWRDRTSITMDDEMIGTPSYMSPEMVSGDPVDHRSDLYQAGLVLYEMLTAKRATTGQTLDQIWEVILKKVPTSVKFFNPDAPIALVNLVQNLVEKKSADRYQSIDEIREDIAAVRGGREVQRRRNRAAMTATAEIPGMKPPGIDKNTTKPMAPAKVNAPPIGGQKAPAPRPVPKPFGPSEGKVREVAPSGGMTMRHKADLAVLMISTICVVFILIKNLKAEDDYPLGIGFKLSLAAFAFALVDLLIGLAMGAVKETAKRVTMQPISVENRLNVPVRIDVRSPTLGNSIERVDARQNRVLEVERGASLTVRKDKGTHVIKSVTAGPGVELILDEEARR
jgi:serine/threonine protein kinase